MRPSKTSDGDSDAFLCMIEASSGSGKVCAVDYFVRNFIRMNAFLPSSLHLFDARKQANHIRAWRKHREANEQSHSLYDLCKLTKIAVGESAIGVSIGVFDVEVMKMVINGVCWEQKMKPCKGGRTRKQIREHLRRTKLSSASLTYLYSQSTPVHPCWKMKSYVVLLGNLRLFLSTTSIFYPAGMVLSMLGRMMMKPWKYLLTSINGCTQSHPMKYE